MTEKNSYLFELPREPLHRLTPSARGSKTHQELDVIHYDAEADVFVVTDGICMVTVAATVDAGCPSFNIPTVCYESAWDTMKAQSLDRTLELIPDHDVIILDQGWREVRYACAPDGEYVDWKPIMDKAPPSDMEDAWDTIALDITMAYRVADVIHYGSGGTSKGTRILFYADRSDADHSVLRLCQTHHLNWLADTDAVFMPLGGTDTEKTRTLKKTSKEDVQ